MIDILKGLPDEPFTGKTNFSLPACGLSMEVGVNYLVFNRVGQLDVGICTGTKKISSEVYDIKKKEIEAILQKASNK